MKSLKWAAFAAFVFLAGCTTAQLQGFQQTAGSLQDNVTRLCAIATPTIASMQAASETPIAALDTVAEDADKVCGQNVTLDTSNVRALVTTGVPAFLTLIHQSNLSTDKKNAVTTAVIGAQTAILLLLPPEPVQASAQS
jgi:hypothetical protein